MFWPNAHQDLLGELGTRDIWHGQAEYRVLKDREIIDHFGMARENVHRGTPHKTANQRGLGPIIDFLWGAELLLSAFAYHHDSVCHRHCLFEIMSCIHHRLIDLFLESFQFPGHLLTDLGIQVGQRLVEQQNPGATDQGPPNGHSSQFSAAESLRQAIEDMSDPQVLRDLPDLAIDLLRWDPSQSKRIGKILVGGQMRVKGHILKDHRYIAFPRRDFIDAFLTEVDIALIRSLQTGNQTEQRCLPCSGRTEQAEELPRIDMETDPVYSFLFLGFSEILNLD